MAESSGKRTAGKVVLGCSGLLFLISLLVTLFCAFHVFIDPRGAISRNEAMPGFLAGGFFSFISFVFIIIGAFLAKKPAASAGGAPGAGGAMYGAPGQFGGAAPMPQMQAPAGMPGGAPAQPPSPPGVAPGQPFAPPGGQGPGGMPPGPAAPAAAPGAQPSAQQPAAPAPAGTMLMEQWKEQK